MVVLSAEAIAVLTTMTNSILNVIIERAKKLSDKKRQKPALGKR